MAKKKTEKSVGPAEIVSPGSKSEGDVQQTSTSVLTPKIPKPTFPLSSGPKLPPIPPKSEGENMPLQRCIVKILLGDKGNMVYGEAGPLYLKDAGDQHAECVDADGKTLHFYGTFVIIVEK